MTLTRQIARAVRSLADARIADLVCSAPDATIARVARLLVPSPDDRDLLKAITALPAVAANDLPELPDLEVPALLPSPPAVPRTLPDDGGAAEVRITRAPILCALVDDVPRDARRANAIAKIEAALREDRAFSAQEIATIVREPAWRIRHALADMKDQGRAFLKGTRKRAVWARTQELADAGSPDSTFARALALLAEDRAFRTTDVARRLSVPMRHAGHVLKTLRGQGKVFGNGLGLGAFWARSQELVDRARGLLRASMRAPDDPVPAPPPAAAPEDPQGARARWLASDPKCEECKGPITEVGKTGPLPRWCSRVCRASAYAKRQLEERRLAGLCQDGCGRDRLPGSARCAECKEHQREIQTDMRRRRGVPERPPPSASPSPAVHEVPEEPLPLPIVLPPPTVTRKERAPAPVLALAAAALAGETAARPRVHLPIATPVAPPARRVSAAERRDREAAIRARVNERARDQREEERLASRYYANAPTEDGERELDDDEQRAVDEVPEASASEWDPEDAPAPTFKVNQRGRARAVPARSIGRRDMTQVSLAVGKTLYPEATAHLRPRTRSECAGGERPCPFVSCQHHLYIDVDENTGTIKLNFPDLEVDQMEESCALDVADRGGSTLNDVGALINVTRERVRQMEEKIFARLQKNRNLRELAGDASFEANPDAHDPDFAPTMDGGGAAEFADAWNW